MELKFIRMVTGEDLISQVTKKDDCYMLINPLRVQYLMSKSGKVGVSLYEWVFVNISSQQEFPIFSSDIITIGTPSERITKYYWEAIANPTAIPDSDDLEESSSEEDTDEDDDDDSQQRNTKRILH